MRIVVIGASSGLGRSIGIALAQRGEQVAMLRVTTANDATSEVPLYVAEDVGRAGFMRRGLDSLLYLATRWIP